jgi:glutamyl-tRNA synthetase
MAGIGPTGPKQGGSACTSMTVATRFATSPSGPLRVGDARRALINWLFARAKGGRFILRIDDLDVEAPPAAPAVEEDLAWLGLAFDERHRQRDRLAHYELALRTLRQAGRVYACYETPDELAAGAEAMLAQGLSPARRRTGHRLTAAEHRAFEDEGRHPHWRFALEEREIAWDDLILGARAFQGGRVDDPVVQHTGGRPSGLFASVVDDVELGVTHVIRSEDELADTPVEIQIMQALGGFLPRFAHLPRLVGAGGEELDEGSVSLEALREQGIEPVALCSVLAALGTPESPRAAVRPEDLADGFALSELGRAPPRFDMETLERSSAGLRRP